MESSSLDMMLSQSTNLVIGPSQLSLKSLAPRILTSPDTENSTTYKLLPCAPWKCCQPGSTVPKIYSEEHWYHSMLFLEIKKKKFAIKKDNWQSSVFYLSWDSQAHLLTEGSDKYCVKEKYLTYHKLAFWNIFDYWTPMFLVVGMILITSWKCCRELWLEFSEVLGPDACITGFFLEGLVIQSWLGLDTFILYWWCWHSFFPPDPPECCRAGPRSELFLVI